MHPIHYFRSKTHILGGFAPFVCSKCTVAKSVPRLLFWHESRPTKLFSSFSAKTHPIHYVQSKTHVLCVFAPFGYRKCTFAKSVPWMPFWHEFGPMKLLSSFSAKTHPIHNFWSKTHILGGFAPFVCRKCTVPKSDPRMPFWHDFRPMKPFSRFSAKMHPMHYIWSKAHVLAVSHHLVAACRPLQNQVLGCRFGTGLGRPNYCRIFWPKSIQSTTLGPKLTFWVVSHHLVAESAQS